MIGQSLGANEAVLLFLDSVDEPEAVSEHTKCVQKFLTERNGLKHVGITSSSVVVTIGLPKVVRQIVAHSIVWRASRAAV